MPMQHSPDPVRQDLTVAVKAEARRLHVSIWRAYSLRAAPCNAAWYAEGKQAGFVWDRRVRYTEGDQTPGDCVRRCVRCEI